MIGSAEFLLGTAGVSATLLGTFIVGVFFYIDSDRHRQLSATEAADLYLRSGTRWVFAAYAVPLLVPLALVGVGRFWGTVLFALLGAMLLAATVDTGMRIAMKGGSGMSVALVINEWVTSVVVVAAMALPWILGGWLPAVADFTPSLLLVLASAFSSTAALVMAQFDATMGMLPVPPVRPGQTRRRRRAELDGDR